jgi:Icc-related predicted phosphoesterase
MKLYLGSDLHIEFGPLEVHNNDNADVLILSGDIVVASALANYDSTGIIEASKKGKTFLDFFQQCSSKFKDVIYVMGNHEHYDGDYANTADILKKVLKEYGNIHLLDREVKTIGDVTFIGGTLWTDMNKEDDYTLYHIQRSMNDFQIVKNSKRARTQRVPIYKRDENGVLLASMEVDHYEFKEYPSTFCPQDAVVEHKEMLQYISTVVEGNHDKKYVVVGHHAPSKLSTKPNYKHDTLMNGGYSSDLSEFILDRPQIKLWTHGHTHDNFDYMIGTTRVVCNPRGYIGYERGSEDFDFQLLEI